MGSTRSLWLSALLATAPLTAQEAYLKGALSDPGHEFGGALAIDGDRIVVGARHEDTGNPVAPSSGAAYVYRSDGTSWTPDGFLKAANVGTLDLFGSAVAISGDTIVVGAPREASAATGVGGSDSDNSAPAAGAAYVFVHDGVGWIQQAYLKASNTDAGDEFGAAVAISGDTIVVAAASEASGATGIDSDQLDDGAVDAGAAYVFVRAGTVWSQQAYLKASNTDAGDEFGTSVAVSGDTVVVGARGEDSSAVGVGGDDQDDGSSSAGAAYVFVRSGSTWSQQAYLKASNTQNQDHFGGAVAISGDTLVIGAKDEDSLADGVGGDQANNGAPSAGAAYVFARSGSTWSQEAYLKGFDSESSDGFGHALSIAGDRVVVGAPNEDSGAVGLNGDEQHNGASSSGAAFAFARHAGSWYAVGYLKATNTDPGDAFGTAVGAAGARIALGAPSEDGSAVVVDGNQSDNGAPSSGAAYVYDGLPEPLVYCSAKPSSAGCTAAISTSVPVLLPTSGDGGYAVTASGVHEQKNGLLFAGTAGAATIPFSGGTLCVQPPLKRGPILGSGGATMNGCAGSFATIVNDFQFPLGLDAGPGGTAWYQYWYRDPANGAGTLGTALSDAVELSFF